MWPIEYLFPYPYIIEEAFKALLVWHGVRSIKVCCLAGIAFAFTENVLYAININFVGELQFLFIRLLATSLLHILAFLILFFFWRWQKKMIVFGFVVAAALHFLYNLFVPGFFVIGQ